MKNKISRRDFLKLASSIPLSVVGAHLIEPLSQIQQNRKTQNVIIIVFDALSAYHISLYGYQRETMPNLTRLAERAVVYHNHYAGGNFTTPGTMSLLTGTLPWSHRAFANNATADKEYIDKNVFSAFQNHYRLTYTHNPWVNTILRQFRINIDEYIKRSQLFLNNSHFIHLLFEGGDEDISFLSWRRIMQSTDDGYAYSLFLSHLLRRYDKRFETELEKLKSVYPRGIPAMGVDDYFLLETAIDWFYERTRTLPKPFLSYLHFLPPHDPYTTHRDFYQCFKGDGLKPISKPVDTLQYFEDSRFKHALKYRMFYDEYIRYVDREFGRLLDYLKSSDLLNTTWVILTSDHGEMFERGVIGHFTPLLYEPVIRIPLIIFEPGRKMRQDVFTPTSAVDLLPTLLHVTGQPPADWTEGIVLPPYSTFYPNENRSIYAIEARNNAKHGPLTTVTVALIKGQYKLMYFTGYDDLNGDERVKLYDIENDPEEINELHHKISEKTDEMLNALKEKLTEVNIPYLKSGK